MARWFARCSLFFFSILPIQALAQAPQKRPFLRDSLSVFRPGPPDTFRALPLDSLLRRPAARFWSDPAREASAMDPGILILPDSTLDAALRLLTPEEGVDEAMIFPRIFPRTPRE